MDQHKVALEALLGLVGDLPGHQLRDDISVDRIPRSGTPTLFLVTLTGAAKMQLQSLLFQITGHADRYGAGVWVLDRRDVAELMVAARNFLPV